MAVIRSGEELIELLEEEGQYVTIRLFRFDGMGYILQGFLELSPDMVSKLAGELEKMRAGMREHGLL